jgi:hypothetical protein
MMCAAVAPGIVAAASLLGAPTAGATCASFFGIGNSAFCTSSPTSVAIAIGDNAWARADGAFGTAIAIGDQSQAFIVLGRFNLATAVGYHTVAAADYDLSLSFAFGDRSLANAAGQPGNKLRVGDVAITFSPGQPNGRAISDGVGSVALNFFGNGSTAYAAGRGSTAVVAGTYDANSYATGDFVSATAVLSHSTVVNAGPGPLAIAGAIGQKNVTVTKVGTGININGISLGGNKTIAHHSNVATSKGDRSGTGRSARH